MAQRIDQSLVDFDVGFEDGKPVPTCGLGYGIEQDRDETPMDIAADMLAKIFSTIIPPSGPLRLDLIGQKFVAVHFLMNRSGTATLTSMAARAGVSKQLLDHHAVSLAEKLNFRGFGQKKESARPSYAAAARAHWATLTPEQRKARRRGKERGAFDNAPEAE